MTDIVQTSIGLCLDCQEQNLAVADKSLAVFSDCQLFSEIYFFNRLLPEFNGVEDYAHIAQNDLVFFLEESHGVYDWHCWIPAVKAVLNIGLSNQRLQYRCGVSNLQHELLLKAIKGRGSLAGLRVLDATAGLMRDSALLAAAGCHVLAVERIPLLTKLLGISVEQNCLQQSGMAGLETTLANAALDVICADSLDLLAHWKDYADILPETWDKNQVESPDVVYLDPMYVQGLKSSAALKKEMTFLKLLNAAYDLQPNPQQDKALLLAAKDVALKKVVVKRAPKAEPLGGVMPASSVLGKSLRFDIYPV